MAADEAELVEEMWGDRRRFPGHVLFLSRRKKALRTWFNNGRAEVTGFREGHAFVVTGVRRNGETYVGKPAGARMVIYVPGVEAHGGGRSSVMRHELTHTVTMRAWGAGDTQRPNPASWAVEGFASFIQVRGDPAGEAGLRSSAVNGFNGSLPLSKGFQQGDDVHANYAVSYTMFRFIEQIRDLETAIDFYAEIVRYDDDVFDAGEPFAGTPAFSGVCERVVGIDGATLLDQWVSFVRAGA